MNQNRMYNSKNPFQGAFKRVLCVCSAGLLRSPTAAFVLSQEPYNYNTRAVGIDSGHALIPLEPVHLYWADEIVCMDEYQQQLIIAEIVRNNLDTPPIINLQIEDSFAYRDPRLIEKIKERYNETKLCES